MVSSLILLSACTYQFINTLILFIFRYVASADSNCNGIYVYGCNGRAKITTSDGITFDFKESKKSTWSDVSYGILDEIFYIEQ